MLENNIIRGYKDSFSGSGILDLDKTNFLKKEDGKITYVDNGIIKLSCNLGDYVLNSMPKEYCDAEIFFSQFYSRFGFMVPIYFMVRKFGIDYLASNVVINNKVSLDNYLKGKCSILPYYSMSDNDILAEDFSKLCAHLVTNENMPNYEKLKYYFESKKEHKKGNKEDLSFDKKGRIMSSLFLKNNENFISLFSKNAIVEKIKMGLIDIVMLNSSRNAKNYVLKTINNSNDVQISNVVPLNNGNSANNIFSRIYRRKDTPYSKKFPYETLYSKASVEKIINDVKTNFKLNTYFSRDSRVNFAYEIDKIIDDDISQEIKENTGYSLNKFYQDEVYLEAKNLSDNLKSGIRNLCL